MLRREIVLTSVRFRRIKIHAGFQVASVDWSFVGRPHQVLRLSFYPSLTFVRSQASAFFTQFRNL